MGLLEQVGLEQVLVVVGLLVWVQFWIEQQVVQQLELLLVQLMWVVGLVVRALLGNELLIKSIEGYFLPTL